MSEPIYKAQNINGKFNHLEGKQAALAYARGIENDETLTESDLVSCYGWNFKEVSDEEARAVGFNRPG